MTATEARKEIDAGKIVTLRTCTICREPIRMRRNRNTKEFEVDSCICRGSGTRANVHVTVSEADDILSQRFPA